jgi:transposase-like protein
VSDCLLPTLKNLYASALLRKAIKTRGAFPSEDAALKVMYLALKNLTKKWQSIQGWRDAMNVGVRASPFFWRISEGDVLGS